MAKVIHFVILFFKVFMQKPLHMVEKKRVLFSCIRPHSNQIFIEFILAVMTSRYGHDVSILIDWRLLRHHDSEHLNDTNLDRNTGRFKYSLIKGKMLILLAIIWFLAKVAGIRFILLSKMYDQQDYVLSVSEMDHVLSSCKRYSSNPSFLSNLNNEQYYHDCIYNVKLIRKNIEYLHREYLWETVVSSHGIYVSWGIIHDYLSEIGVDTRVYLNCIYKTGSLWVSKHASQKIYLEYVAENNLPNDGYERLQARIQYESPDNKIYFQGDLSKVKIDKRSAKLTFGLFPNVIWDGAIAERDRVFTGLLEWIIHTIKEVRESENNLIIRFHPAEATLTKWAESLENIVAAHVTDLYQIPNVTVISSGDQIDLYELIREDIDVGLVYDGILGLEITELGKPVVSVANARYSKGGFCYEVYDKHVYNDILLGHCDLNKWFFSFKDEIHNNLKAYSNAYLGRDLFTFPMFNGHYWDVNLSFHRDFLSLESPENMLLFDRLCGNC